jgi:peptidoglycan/LPS O-acetylase OafA/YrhL
MHVRMPLFAFLSGLVYAFWPVRPGTLRVFLRKKVRRLVLPLITVSTIYYLLSRCLPYDKETPAGWEFWRIYAFPFAQYWFLQAMVIVFAIVALLDRFAALAGVWKFWLAYAVSVVLCIAVRVEADVFSVDHAFELLPFFLLGVAAVRFQGWMLDQRTGAVCATAFIVVMVWYSYTIFALGGPVIPKRTLSGFAMSTVGLIALFHVCRPSRTLEAIGRRSFAIFLFHAFFTAGTRAVLKLSPVGVHQVVLFALSVAAGIIGPIVIEHVVGRSIWLSRAFLGRSWPPHGVPDVAG